MSQGFRLKYDQIRENDKPRQEAEQSVSRAFDEVYPDEGHARSVCFVWPDGKRMFLQYSYLVSGEYLPDVSTITLTFTTHIIVLKGVNLEGLFYDLMNQIIRQITCVDERYNLVGDDEKFVVNKIVATTA